MRGRRWQAPGRQSHQGACYLIQTELQHPALGKPRSRRTPTVHRIVAAPRLHPGQSCVPDALTVFSRSFIAIGLIGCATACGTLSLGPSDVVVAAYREANAGQFSQADSYVTNDFKSIEAQDSGSRLVWRVNTRNQSLRSISPTRTDTSGDTSTVAQP